MTNPNRLGLTLNQRLPILAGVVYSSSLPSTTSVTCSLVASVPQLSKVLKRRISGFRTPRRVVLGLGVSFWAQFMSMAGNLGGKSLIASARQKGAIEQVLKNVEWPAQFPFKEEDFRRFDESPDLLFYEAPRFVTHIDDPAIAALSKYYSQVLPPSNTPGVAVLDICSSWVSHYPAGYKQERIVGMGMNEEELKKNPVLTEYVVQDLNFDPKLPLADNSFDVITNVVCISLPIF
ncbi:unnamed protein product [Ilex paraguariensis]|uniref:Methyltransferase type 11 domain-containing protein n=1 Tax=Ilex paraguariensis TaxID=185542 RepID=A0ABC8QQI4_9AQUA